MVLPERETKEMKEERRSEGLKRVIIATTYGGLNLTSGLPHTVPHAIPTTTESKQLEQLACCRPSSQNHQLSCCLLSMVPIEVKERMQPQERPHLLFLYHGVGDGDEGGVSHSLCPWGQNQDAEVSEDIRFPTAPFLWGCNTLSFQAGHHPNSWKALILICEDGFVVHCQPDMFDKHFWEKSHS